MALPTFKPPVRPSPGTSRKPQINLWEADFGDGYSQPTPKGINHIRKTVGLTWKVLTIEQMRQIEDFLEAQQGNKPFYFDPWGERTMLKWTCKTWESSTEEGIWSVKAEFVQSFSHVR